MHLHLVHTKNDIDPLIFQDNKSGVKHLPSKLEWDFMGHLISNHSASESANRIRHLGSIESNAGLLSTGQAQEIMQSSRIKQNNDQVLIQ
jgi:ABC-type lipopolysaccharide export system ATPase subunit